MSLINSNVSILTNALDWLDATIAAFLGSYHGSIGSQCEPEHYGTMEVDLRLELPSEQILVSNSQIHRVQLSGMRKDFRFFWEVSNLDDVLDAILSTDVPLCMAPKSGLYNLSSYEVCSRLRINHISRTDPKTLFSNFADVSAPAYRCWVAQTNAPSIRRTRMTTELVTWWLDFSVNWPARLLPLSRKFSNIFDDAVLPIVIDEGPQI